MDVVSIQSSCVKVSAQSGVNISFSQIRVCGTSGAAPVHHPTKYTSPCKMPNGVSHRTRARRLFPCKYVKDGQGTDTISRIFGITRTHTQLWRYRARNNHRTPARWLAHLRRIQTASPPSNVRLNTNLTRVRNMFDLDEINGRASLKLSQMEVAQTKFGLVGVHHGDLTLYRCSHHITI